MSSVEHDVEGCGLAKVGERRGEAIFPALGEVRTRVVPAGPAIPCRCVDREANPRIRREWLDAPGRRLQARNAMFLSAEGVTQRWLPGFEGGAAFPIPALR
ncbi:hypothetical protein [Methylobacterium iners]|uniref:hypothetical protein n=1 Tax=Methylobacterium iners TaxID=418707 RepID=UPI001EE18415|nr:hypothetical protein [Methylobacterium iners]